jgi:hypothetical protein
MITPKKSDNGPQKQTKKSKNHMNNNEHITEDQRKAFADLIREAERRFEKDFDGYFDSIKRDFAPKVEARSRTRNLFEAVRSMKAKLSEALGQLRSMGYHVDDGMIAIDYEPQDNGRHELEAIQQEAVEQRNVRRLKFRKALFNVLSAQTVDEARQLVEQVVA